MSPLLFVILYLLVAGGAFLLGLKFYRTSDARGDVTPEQSRRFGRLLMMAATALLIFPIALWFHGDLKLELGR